MNEVEMIQGMTDYFAVSILNSDGTDYEPVEGDVVRLGVKHDTARQAYDIIKTGVYDSEQGCFIFSFSPSDTSALKATDYGERYMYDVSLQSGSDIFTVIPPTQMLLYRAVTHLEVTP